MVIRGGGCLLDPAVLIFLSLTFGRLTLRSIHWLVRHLLPLVKVVDRLLFCVLQLIRKGPYKIRRFPSVSAYAFRISNALLPFPLTLAFLTYFCKYLLELNGVKKIDKTGKLTIFQGVCQHSMHRHLP